MSDKLKLLSNARLKKMCKILFTVFLLMFLFWKFGMKFSTVYSGISNWTALFMTFCVYCICSLISANRWRMFLFVAGIREDFFWLWRTLMISAFQGMVFPSAQGCDLLRIFYIEKRHPDKTGIAGSTVIIERLFGLLVLCFFSLGVIPFLLHGQDMKVALIASVGVIACCLGGYSLIFSTRIYKLYSERQYKNVFLEKSVRYFSRLHNALREFPYRRGMVSTIFLIAMFQFCQILAIHLVFDAYGHPVSLVYNITFFPVISILVMLPITIGGIGVREGAFAWFYATVGVPAEVAVCVALTNYIIGSLFGVVCGGLLSLGTCSKGDASSTSK